MSGRRHLAVIAAACVVLGGLLLTEQGWIAAKAAVARQLIDRAYSAHLRDGREHRPWSWADTHPLARLSVPQLGVERTILAGASGASLAFGPGHVDGTARPNSAGNCVVAGHRDSWFAFLEDLRPGDELVLETRDEVRHYRVVTTEVHSMWDGEVSAGTTSTRLTLVTCYPFGALTGSDRRYVVVALPMPRADDTA
jgi:sortase A